MPRSPMGRNQASTARTCNSIEDIRQVLEAYVTTGFDEELGGRKLPPFRQQTLISCGEHDLSENIVYLVLAKIEGTSWKYPGPPLPGTQVSGRSRLQPGKLCNLLSENLLSENCRDAFHSPSHSALMYILVLFSHFPSFSTSRAIDGRPNEWRSGKLPTLNGMPFTEKGIPDGAGGSSTVFRG